MAWAGGCGEVRCVGVLDVGAFMYVYTMRKNKPRPLPSQQSNLVQIAIGYHTWHHLANLICTCNAIDYHTIPYE